MQYFQSGFCCHGQVCRASTGSGWASKEAWRRNYIIYRVHLTALFTLFWGEGGSLNGGSRAGWDASMGSPVIPLCLYTYVSSLAWERFRIDIGRNFFPMRTVTPWHRLPREIVQSVPSGHFPNLPLPVWIVLWSYRKEGAAFCLSECWRSFKSRLFSLYVWIHRWYKHHSSKICFVV